MIFFQRVDKTYRIKGSNSELPTSIVLNYPHHIDEDEGYLDIGISINSTVRVFSTVDDKLKNINGNRVEKVKEFCVFGGALCVRFFGSNIPHAIDCISLIS